MTFQTPSNATEFINSIQSVCPCKANPPQPPTATPTPMRMTTMNPPAHTPNSQLAHLPRNASFQTPQRGRKRAYTELESSTPMFSSSPISDPSCLAQFPDSDERMQLGSSQRWSSQTTMMATNSQQVDGTASRTISSEVAGTMTQDHLMAAPSEPLPSSSMPAASPSFEEDMLVAIQQATGLYGMSASTLERAVGDIVREDAFPSLVGTF